MKKFGFLIGRFQTHVIHQGHRELLQQSAQNCDHLIVLLGSANMPPSPKNPFSFKQRKWMISDFLNRLDIPYTILPLNDYKYNDSQWISDVNLCVETVVSYDSFLNRAKITLFGHQKEDTNYLDWFPQYDKMLFQTKTDISGTQVRNDALKNVPEVFPNSVLDDLTFYEKEKIRFADYPFKETLNFNCADAVVTCSGHILLIRRKFAPGAGSWALPGGFKNANETFLQCALRELDEETNIRVTEKVLLGSVVKSELFDSPTRSYGVPRNTLAVWFDIKPNPDGSLPRANGGDDAQETKWFQISDAMNTIAMYDDHKSIVSKMTGINPVPAHLNSVITG